MTMELGSEFDLDLSRLADTSDTVFAYLNEFHTVYTDSGRSALRLLSERLSGETILIPDYICETVPDALPGDCHVIRYPVNRRFWIDVDRLSELIRESSARVLYLMHYFGTLQPDSCIDRIAQLKETYHLTVIEDMTHALFTAKRTVGDYMIASLRKWFPIPDGGVLYCMDESLLPRKFLDKKAASRKVEAMLLKHLYLTEKYDCNAKYRELFVREEEAFDRQPGIYGMSDVSRFLLARFPVTEMCERRRINAAWLLECLRGSMCEACPDARAGGSAGAAMSRLSDAMPAVPVCVGVTQLSDTVPAVLACGEAPRLPGGMQTVPARGEAPRLPGVIPTVPARAEAPQFPAVMLAVPVYAAERDRLRERLMEHRIYCAVHWPPGHAPVYGDTRWIGRHILSLPVDQRYGAREMEYLAECVRSCAGETGSEG